VARIKNFRRIAARCDKLAIDVGAAFRRAAAVSCWL
jgi:hypothetical protein